MRLTVGKDALELWSQYPILGSGLGGFLKYQTEKYGQPLDQIDNSALWVLTELGIVGALLFGSFFIAALICLLRKLKHAETLLEKLK